MAEMVKPRIRVRADGTIPRGQALGGFVTPGNQTRDAARHDLSEFSGWRPNLRFAGTTNYGERDTVMDRARDLDENNGWINGGIDRRVESVIGINIRLSAQPRHALLNRDYDWRMKWTADVQDRFFVWANDIERRCDARMRLSFGAQAKLAYLTYVRDGEVAAEIRDDARGASNSTNVMLVECERISTPQNNLAIEGPALRNGIAFDQNGAAAGYWVRSGHPADRSPQIQSMRWDYIPARGPTGRAKFLHVYNPRRTEQNRGISRLAEVMVPAKMLDRVDRAEVNAALKAAIFSLFIKSPGSSDDIEAALAPTSDSNTVDPWISAYLDMRADKPVQVEGAQVTHLFTDEDVITPQSTHPNSNYPTFAKFVLQKISSSLGISYPQMSQDWAGINYSSARALLNEIWRGFLEDRHFFTTSFCTPIYAAWLEVEIANGAVKAPGGPANFYRNKTALCNAEWIGPGRGSVDPLKEANANNLDTAAGRKSTVECIIEGGRDPVDVLAEENWYNQTRESMKLDPVNHNVKPDMGADDGSGADGLGGTADDHDGDGKPLENQDQPAKGKKGSEQ